MCGIAGLVDATASTPADALEAAAAGMAATLRHRGPDDAGVWADPSAGVGLGFRRLSIVDLTPTGHQPMRSRDGRYVLVFNGELYNYRALRAELETAGARFDGTSDTEVLLEAIAAWGLARTLDRANAMLALACWDRETRRLYLARDRFGEKPLYYGWSGSTFLFGSETKALRAHAAFRTDVDRDALTRYLRLGYVPAPSSIYTGVSKLPPATYVEIDPATPGRATEPVPYWTAAGAARDAQLRRLPDGDALDSVEAALRESVALRMVADVPVGAFLSGGIDSSLVVSLMQAQSAVPVRTFTIGFHEPGYDEAGRARDVASYLGTDHTELYVTSDEARAVIPRLPQMYDEPFADSSQIPTVLVSELARADVTVALSGDGGDELFGGYTRYQAYARLCRLARAPRAARHAAAAVLRSRPAPWWDRVAAASGRVLPRGTVPSRPGDKLHKLAGALDVRGPDDVYPALVGISDESLVLGASATGHEAFAPVDPGRSAGTAEWAMLADTGAYLPDDILTKVDRATMAASLEARVPMLDPGVFEAAWRLAPGQRVRGGAGKVALTDVLARHVPATLTAGPKTGFGVPVGAWLRGPLRDWAGDLLEPARVRAEGYLDTGTVARCWQEHREGTRDRTHELWAVLMFEAWLESGVRPPERGLA